MKLYATTMTKISRNYNNEHRVFPTNNNYASCYIKSSGWVLSLLSSCSRCYSSIRNWFVLRYCIRFLFVGTVLLLGCRSALHKRFDTRWVLSPINYMERECQYGNYTSIGQLQQQVKNGIVPIESIDPTLIENPDICMITLADGGKRDVLHRLVRWRNFDNIMEMTIPNKQSYCDKHGYHLYDESTRSLDTSRPPSWSKIRAALQMMNRNNNNNNETETTTTTTGTEPKCEWIFWLDADTVIMNSMKRVEDFLPLRNSTVNLIFTEQKGPSWNAGAWLIRNNEWSYEFLKTWWNMKEFVKPKGLSVSGDNDALKYLLTKMYTENKTWFNATIITPPRCLFNSCNKFITNEQSTYYTKLLKYNQTAMIPYYMDPLMYHKNDFIAHVAGKFSKLFLPKNSFSSMYLCSHF